ncbi:Bromodomain containing protein [Trichomonas vaginalis G3]|uniref:Bromodomain containing protein n=1 Tax=Trichomonas vaginalis (strain ATCC PRA-98 / G3) TaxID=412133 RepID=A2F0U5_TRIV3|nr:acetylation-dependent protein binding [Trichomonas vaginalis G3]EAY01480.1 Bromodomain containing protein [Trichomonas vaginalis G3]KAI5523348.1 acetylation-dependent protein binding [Trichomonas vaginalis G3]|eukprot:XP_001314171.1 Bromodomain containing protein [Trichomonas vaginalis G3]
MDDNDKRWCRHFIDELWKWKICQPFRYPVEPEINNCPDYFQIIKQPMDFQTIKYKLNQNSYEDIREFFNDLRLISYNAKQYNGEDTYYGKMAGDILDEVNKRAERKLKFKNDTLDELESLSAQISTLLANPPPEATVSLPVRVNAKSNSKSY